MQSFNEILYDKSVDPYKECLLVGDIGGTNANFGIFSLPENGFKLLFSLHFKSQMITDFTAIVAQVLAYCKERYQISIKKCCLAGAGVVSEARDYCKPTNLNFVLDSKSILAHTELSCCFIVNDFEVIGYGVKVIDPQKLIVINKGNSRTTGNKAILGAGTGLGKCILFWERDINRYVPVASEGGHADFSPQTQLELDLTMYIKQTEHRPCNISWEDVLSGNGIQRMYRFFRHRNKQVSFDKEFANNGPHPDEIFNVRNRDQHSRNTFELYTTFYARCAKNFALDALALSGIYIAGGIAAKNLTLFTQKEFMIEFINCGKQQNLLHDIPIWVIIDYNVSLYGAAQYMVLENIC